VLADLLGRDRDVTAGELEVNVAYARVSSARRVWRGGGGEEGDVDGDEE
jgi:hypothetical protein